jgi:hypothetical protein
MGPISSFGVLHDLRSGRLFSSDDYKKMIDPETIAMFRDFTNRFVIGIIPIGTVSLRAGTKNLEKINGSDTLGGEEFKVATNRPYASRNTTELRMLRQGPSAGFNGSIYLHL